MTEAEVRKKPVEYLQKYLGIKEGSAKHKEIITTFNDSKLCTRYKMTVNDAWCATAVSAAFISSGLTSIFPCVECSCPNMISKAKSAGIWVENDAYKPSAGDVIMYDWQDSGSGDNTGVADHVGIVVSVSGSAIKVIEGNKNDTVAYRTISVNGKYIRGYITPKYSSVATSKATAKTTAKTTTESSSSGLNKTPKWVGKVTASTLNVRTWAGTEYAQIKAYPKLAKGNLVDVCDSVDASDGAEWYYIRISGKYYGFVCAKYIAKQ